MIAIFLAFLCLEGLMLLAAMIYVSPLIGTRSRDAAPVEVAPTLPRCIAIPTKWRRDHAQ